MIEYDASTAYISLDDAMDFFETQSKITGIEVSVDDIYQARKTGGEITEALGFPFYAKNWEDSNRSLFRALRLERMAIGIFLGFIVLVAALNIVSTLTMLVMEKKKGYSRAHIHGCPQGRHKKDIRLRRNDYRNHGNPSWYAFRIPDLPLS